MKSVQFRPGFKDSTRTPIPMVRLIDCKYINSVATCPDSIHFYGQCRSRTERTERAIQS